MSISTFPQSAHKLAMADLTLQRRPSQAVLTLGLGAGRMVALALAFQAAALLAGPSSWPAVLAFAAVVRMMLLVALTRAAFRFAALCLATWRHPHGVGAGCEIIREDSPI
jgi:hypothetical protein